MPYQSIKIDYLTRKGRRQASARLGLRLSESIREASLPLGFSCGGRGVCTACAVWVKGPVSEISVKELNLLTGEETQRENWQRRISCLTYVKSSIEVTTDYW